MSGEDIGDALLVMAGFALSGLLAVWLIQTIIRYDPIIPGRKDRPLPNRNVMYAINAMWENEPFIKEFAKILSDEGDIDKLAALVKSTKKPSDFELAMPETERIWRHIHSIDFEPQPTAKRIVQKLLMTSSYKGIVKRFKLTKEDEQYFAKLLLLTIMRYEFTEYAKDYIFKGIKPGLYLKFLKSISDRNIDGYSLSSPDGR